MKSTPILFAVICSMLTVVAMTTVGQQNKSHQLSSPTDTIEICIPLRGGWQLISNPVYRSAGTDSVRDVFCGEVRCPFSWGGGYLQDCTARNGRGFWLRHEGPSYFCCIAGEPIARDSFAVAPGWNLIGSISFPVPVTAVTSIPPNIVTSRFIKFSTGYARADTLYPGEGYWVKSNAAGRIVISSGF